VVKTSGDANNCLAFSVLMASEQIGQSLQEQCLAQDRSQEERRLTHIEVCEELPPRAKTTTSHGNDEWWCGHNQAKLQDIFDNNLFMGEPHVHGFANRLDRTIIVIDERERLLSLTEYAPGYGVAKQISLTKAKDLSNTVDQLMSEGLGLLSANMFQPLWLLMSSGHWSALSTLEKGKQGARMASVVKTPRPLRNVVLLSDGEGGRHDGRSSPESSLQLSD
jgi:hypothetical protein